MSWAYAYAFRAGEDHEQCDDACVCEALGDYILAAVADGAGSAKHAHEGAAIACQAFIELGVQLFAGSLEPSCLLSAIQERIPEGQWDSYAATLVGIVANSAGALIVQVGDGAAVVRFPEGASRPRVVEMASEHGSQVATADPVSAAGQFVVPIWPEETEFLNHTFFVTMPSAEEHLRVHRIDEPIREFALFTDGLQHLVLDLKTKQPHQPFFESVFKRLHDAPEHDLKASWWLERTLASEPVTKRTDDDTSIVVARRVSC